MKLWRSKEPRPSVEVLVDMEAQRAKMARHMNTAFPLELMSEEDREFVVNALGECANAVAAILERQTGKSGVTTDAFMMVAVNLFLFIIESTADVAGFTPQEKAIFYAHSATNLTLSATDRGRQVLKGARYG